MTKNYVETYSSYTVQQHTCKRIYLCFVILLFLRVNDLDKELKVLTATHKTLQVEATKKGAALEKATCYVTALQQDNGKLQKVCPSFLSVCLSVLRLQITVGHRTNVCQKFRF